MDLHPSWREYGIRPAHEVFEELTRERDELRAENQRMANRVGEVEGWVLGLTAEMDELRAVALGKIRHLYAGRCPDGAQFAQRDPDCPACRALGPHD